MPGRGRWELENTFQWGICSTSRGICDFKSSPCQILTARSSTLGSARTSPSDSAHAVMELFIRETAFAVDRPRAIEQQLLSLSTPCTRRLYRFFRNGPSAARLAAPCYPGGYQLGAFFTCRPNSVLSGLTVFALSIGVPMERRR